MEALHMINSIHWNGIYLFDSQEQGSTSPDTYAIIGTKILKTSHKNQTSILPSSIIYASKFPQILT